MQMTLSLSGYCTVVLSCPCGFRSSFPFPFSFFFYGEQAALHTVMQEMLSSQQEFYGGSKCTLVLALLFLPWG